jgi:hypothetical protein
MWKKKIRDHKTKIQQAMSVAGFNGLRTFPMLKQRLTVLRLVASSK